MSGLQQHHVQAPVAQSCSFCGYSIPLEPVGDPSLPFCSEPCRDAYERAEQPFEGAVGFKVRPVGVEALRPALPNGIPGNAAVLLAGQEGTRREGLLLEWIWRTLRAGEPAVVAAIDKPPSVLVDSFLAHGWNVLPFLAREQLVLVDLFTERLEDEAAFSKRNDRWNSYVQRAFARGFRQLRDPGDVREVSNQLDSLLVDLGMTDTGVVAIESVAELASFSQAVQAANFLKEVRATISKSRYVPLLASASVEREDDLYRTQFPHDHEYVFDGIVDLELNDEMIEGSRVKRLSVRKMDDVASNADWIPYEFQAGTGYVPVSM